MVFTTGEASSPRLLVETMRCRHARHALDIGDPQLDASAHLSIMEKVRAAYFVNTTG